MVTSFIVSVETCHSPKYSEKQADKEAIKTTTCQPGVTRTYRKTLEAANDSQEAAAPPVCI